MQPGDLIRYTFYEDPTVYTELEGDDRNSCSLIGVVIRGGQYNALVLLNGRSEAGWISEEYLEVVSNASS